MYITISILSIHQKSVHPVVGIKQSFERIALAVAVEKYLFRKNIGGIQ
jgi:hypothetical protein